MKNRNLPPVSDNFFLPLVIIGSGGHAVSTANVALSAGYTIKCFVDNNKGKSLMGYEIIGDVMDLVRIHDFNFAIAVGDNASRQRTYIKLIEEYGSMHFPPLIHQSAEVCFYSQVGNGTVVMPHAIIGPNSKVGMFCLINTQASIDHNCVMSDFSSLAPAASTGGRVQLGLRSAICIGAKIKHNINIGKDSIVGANSYLNKDLADNQVAYGTPARKIRARHTDDTYL